VAHEAQRLDDDDDHRQPFHEPRSAITGYQIAAAALFPE
jgi:hypothetical protein